MCWPTFPALFHPLTQTMLVALEQLLQNQFVAEDLTDYYT